MRCWCRSHVARRLRRAGPAAIMVAGVATVSIPAHGGQNPGEPTLFLDRPAARALPLAVVSAVGVSAVGFAAPPQAAEWESDLRAIEGPPGVVVTRDANGNSARPQMTADGRLVVFDSTASNLPCGPCTQPVADDSLVTDIYARLTRLI